MVKINDNISVQGTIIEQYSQEAYRVKLTNGQELLCYTTNRFRIPSQKGKGMRKPKIGIGDKVKVELHPQGSDYGMLVGFST